jgi:hypothetical protein
MFDVSSVCPSTVTCVQVKGTKDQRIRYNRRISIDETASEMNINHRKTLCKNASRSNRKHLMEIK